MTAAQTVAFGGLAGGLIAATGGLAGVIGVIGVGVFLALKGGQN